MLKSEAWEACKAEIGSKDWTIADEACYRAFFGLGYDAGAGVWKEAARLMGEELKKYAPNKGDVLRELGGE